MVIGDLSFFYDMNALWNQQIHANLRILLINNEGGEIFHTLPGMDTKSKSRQYITAEHCTSAKGWAEERGFTYLSAHNQEDIDACISQFTTPETQEKPMLLEVFTDKETDTTLLRNYYKMIKNK